MGKSTLAQAIARTDWKAPYITLDERIVLDTALTNPDGFIFETGWPAVIDEVQRAPDLLRAIKLIVDKERKTGLYLLTGSANVLTLSKVSESLAGRVAVYELLPFSWSEIHEKPPPIILDAIFSATRARDVLNSLPSNSTPERVEEIKERILWGGFPTPALMSSTSAKRKWFDSYRQTYIERDLRDLSGIFRVPEFNRLLTSLALSTGQLLNFSELSREIGIPLTTLRRYFGLLVQTYQVHLVSPYSGNVGKRLMKTPKLYITDTGVACHMSGTDSWETLVKQNRIGGMVETWVANELRKLITLSELRTELLYWRTRTGHEVDFLLEQRGEIVGIEVKWGSSFGRGDLSGLKKCQEALGERWRFGILLYGGNRTLALDEKTIAIPFSVFFGVE